MKDLWSTEFSARFILLWSFICWRQILLHSTVPWSCFFEFVRRILVRLSGRPGKQIWADRFEPGGLGPFDDWQRGHMINLSSIPLYCFNSSFSRRAFFTASETAVGIKFILAPWPSSTLGFQLGKTHLMVFSQLACVKKVSCIYQKALSNPTAYGQTILRFVISPFLAAL